MPIYYLFYPWEREVSTEVWGDIHGLNLQEKGLAEERRALIFLHIIRLSAF